MTVRRQAEPSRHRVRDAFATTAVALLAFAVGIVLFNSVVMPRIVHRAGEVIVPDVETLTVAQARSTLEPAGLGLSRAARMRAGERDPRCSPRCRPCSSTCCARRRSAS